MVDKALDMTSIDWPSIYDSNAEQNVGTPAQVPTNPPLTSACPTCGQPVPPVDYSLENLPALPPGAADLVLTAAQAARFLNAYLELFKFWWNHNFPVKGNS